MNPLQMLRRTPEVKIEWQPRPRAGPILLPASNLSQNQLLMLEYDESLRAGRCPICHHAIDSRIDQQSMLVYFTCRKNSVFHDFRRPLSFITTD